MCSGEVEMKVWMRGRAAWRTASQQRSMSPRPARARPHTVAFLTSLAISRTASKSPLEAMGKPASITSIAISSRRSAILIFSSRFIDAPGDCSPSRKVVSKIMTRCSGRPWPVSDLVRVVVALMARILMCGSDIRAFTGILPGITPERAPAQMWRRSRARKSQRSLATPRERETERGRHGHARRPGPFAPSPAAP